MNSISFNDRCGLTEAVILGSKTQEVKRFPPKLQTFIDWQRLDDGHTDCVRNPDGEGWLDIFCFSHYVKGGDIGVAQSPSELRLKGFKQDNKTNVNHLRLPHRILIEDVRIGKVQDLTYEDLLKEGLNVIDGKYRMGMGKIYPTYTQAFASHFNMTRDVERWEANPYVFIYDFRLLW